LIRKLYNLLILIFPIKYNENQRIISDYIFVTQME